jgi:hypothetical protein
MIKRLFLLIAVLGAFTVNAQSLRKTKVSLVELQANLGKTNTFTLKAEIETFGPEKIMLLTGGICAINPRSIINGDSGSFWTKDPKAILSYEDQAYFLNCPKKGKYTVKLNFVSKIKKEALQRKCVFYLLPALIRKVSLNLSSKDIEPKINNCTALSKLGKGKYSGVLQTSGDFSMSWKKLMDSKTVVLAVNAEVYGVGSVLTGAVKLNTKILYKIFQGSLKQLRLRVPKGLNILAVKGKDIRDWRVSEKDSQVIIVDLNTKQYKKYILDIQAEQILTKTPCTFNLRPIVPENVMRLDGSLRFGSGRGVKLLIEDTPGLVQIDNSSFSKILLPQHAFALLNPLSYNFSGEDYQLKAKVENISPSYTASMNCVSTCGDRALQVRLDCTLDIKDAPLRELSIQYEPSLTFSRVIGKYINPQDYDLTSDKSKKTVKVSFHKPVYGKVAFSIYFERELKNISSFNIPNFKVEGAKSVRGYLLLAVDRGLKLMPEGLKNLTPVHPGSLPIRQNRLQYAYLFRNQDWNGTVKIEHVKGNIVSEVFNLVSAGEGTAYGSSIISFHISGAPVDSLRFIVGDNMKNLEFKGRNIISRKKIDAGEKGFSIWDVKLRKKQLGDITLLATYEMSIKDGGTLRLGAISAADSDFSSSYTALAGVKSLKVSSAKAAPTVQEIDQSELPSEYLQMINNPLLKVYRGAGKNQWQDVEISRYEKCKMPQTVIDRTELKTRLDGNGGSVTTAQYRIKNSTGQFLSLKLPDKSDLWKVSVDGRPKRLSISDGRLLIPLPRHRNINMPIAITVIYARQFGDISDQVAINLDAPQTEIKSLFCEWLVTVPENCAIVSSSPVPVKRSEAFSRGFAGIMERLGFYATTRSGVVFIFAWIFVTVIGSIFLKYCAEDKKIQAGIAFIITLFVLFVASAVILNSLSRYIQPIHSFIVNQATFNRVMGLDGKAFAVNLVVKNMETASMWSIIYALLSIVAAAVILFVRKMLQKKILKTLCVGLSCALVVFAVSQWFKLSIYSGLILAVAIPISLSVGIWLKTWRKFRAASLAIITITMLCIVPAQARKIRVQQQQVPDGIAIESISCTGIPWKKAVKTTYKYKIKADKPGNVKLLSPPGLITGIHEKDNDWEIIQERGNYILKIKEKGEYEITIDIESPIKHQDGKLTFSLPVPECISNSFVLTTKYPIETPWLTPRKNKSKIKALNAITTNWDGEKIKACFIPGTTALFEISEKAQQADGAALTFFAKTISFVTVGRGSAEIQNSVSLNIPQGSLKVLDLTIPANMRVTSVLSKDLEAWRFDHKTNILKVFFSKAQSDNCLVTINSQIPNGKLPRSISITPLKLVKANKQYGSLGIFVNQEVKVSETDNKNFTPINNDFFSTSTLASASLKKTFRYSGTDASMILEVTEVKPELRVVEKSQVSFEDERITLDSELMLNIIKGGIFSVQLQLPKGFEINRLTGPSIQHWDEVNTNGNPKVIINFVKRLSGKNTFNISLSKMISDNYKNASIPAIRIVDARKHTGSLSVNVEKGTTISILKRNGITVSSDKLRFAGNDSNFKILRPDWSLQVAFVVTPPWIQVKTLQDINIKAHNIECNTFFNYSIENAGVKRFKIALPANCAAPEFSGRYIRSAGKLKGNIWAIELDRKVERSYRLKVRCQLKLNKDKTLNILPFVSTDSGIQTGYIALFAEDSLQLKTMAQKGELSNFNSRNVPAVFGAKNLSNAILCFRSVGKDCDAQIEIIRHKNASTLKATVDSVAIKSLIANSGQVLSKATLAVNNNNETFLPIRLPEGCTLWAAFVDSAPVEAVKSGDLSLIPLKQNTSTGSCKQNVQFIYSIASNAKWTPRNQGYKGPLFGLPLKDIKWEVYLPEDREYSSFDGTLKYRDELLSALGISSISDYDTVIQERVKLEATKAQKLFSLGRSYMRKGKNKKAFEVLNTANAFTGNKALQSDIQGQQLINSRMQNVYNMSKRRSAISQSSQMKSAPKQQSNMQALRQQMGDEELKNLQSISDKIFMQQQAAASMPRLFDISIPWKGKKITFERALEIRKDAPLEIKFKSSQKMKATPFTAPLLFAGLAILFALIYSLIAKKEEVV